MKRLFKIMSLLVVLCVAVLVAGVAILKTQDYNAYRELIAEQVKALTGRDLVIAGDLKLDLSANPSISVKNVRFANAAWGSRPEMAVLERLEARVELLPLLSGDVQVQEVVLTGLDLLMETDETGRGNWIFEGMAQQAPAASAKPGDDVVAGDAQPVLLPVVHNVRIENVRVSFHDGVNQNHQSFAIDHLKISARSANSRLDFSLRGGLNGAPYTLAGQLGSIRNIIEGKRAFPVDVTGRAFGFDIGVDGSVKDLRSASGYKMIVSAKTVDLGAALKSLSAVAPEAASVALPVAMPLTVSATVRDTKSGFAANDIAVQLGGSDVAGKISLTTGERPRLNVDLKSKRVNVDQFLIRKDSGAGAGAEASKSSGVAGTPGTASSRDAGNATDTAKRAFPDDPLPLDGLKAIDAHVLYRAGRIDASGMRIDDVGLEVFLDKGRLAVEPFSFRLADGGVRGGGVVNARRKKASMSLRIKADNIDFAKLIANFDDSGMLSGRAGLTVDVKTRGNSVRAMMAKLNGSTRVKITDGRIESGILGLLSGDLLSSVMPWASGQDSNALNCAVAGFDIRSGMAKANALLVDTGGISLVGDGTVDLERELLNLSFDPRAKNVSLMKLSIPFEVTGSFLDPGVAPKMGEALLGTAVGAVSTIAGLATGGVSALASVVGMGGEPDKTDYCALALAGKPLKRAKTAAKTQTQDSSPSSAPTTTISPPATGGSTLENATQDLGDAAKGLSEGIGGALKGLFGN